MLIHETLHDDINAMLRIDRIAQMFVRYTYAFVKLHVWPKQACPYLE